MFNKFSKIKINTTNAMKQIKLLTLAALLLALAAGCTKNNTNPGYPTGPKPSWGPDIKPQMLAVINKLASYRDTPIYKLTPARARLNHTATDAAMDVMRDHGIPTPVYNVDTTGQTIPVTGGSIHVRIYTPRGATGNLPVIVYYHGGGFVIASIDVYDPSAKLLSANTNAIVVSVGYRLAPEHKFPTAHNDAFDAYKWVVNNAASIKGDVNKLALAGESAGGNLAVATAIMARDQGVKAPVHVLSIYPIASADTLTASKIQYANAQPLNKPSLSWFNYYYLNTPADAMDPRINLAGAKLAGLPQVTIINAELDPLQTDGALLETALTGAGVSVQRMVYGGVTHEFFGMGAVVPDAKDAENFAVSRLRASFGTAQ